MRVLAVDTATEACSAALWLDGHVLHREAELERGHAEHILVMVDAVLREASLSLRGLDAVAFGRGPGAFTGVRLAASVAQGLAFGAGLPVVGVSDLRAVAQRLLDGKPEVNRVLVCNDARMKEVYWGCFEADAGEMSSHGAEHVGKPDAVILPVEWTGAVYGAGRGFAACPELRQRWAGRLAAIDDRILPHAREVARLATTELRAGRAVRPEEAVPVYLRDEVARPRP